MSTDIPQSLRSLVTTKFFQAQASQDLTFSKTELATLPNKSGLLFQLRYCPSLAKKPTNNTTNPSGKSDGKKQKKPNFDPFERPSQALLVTPVPSNNDTKPSHNIILNKFPVIPNHFILSTKENKPQTDLLEADDIRLTYECIKAWHGEKKSSESRAPSLFAFFNSGRHSGASQPHRHVQFLPVEAMRSGGGGGESVDLDDNDGRNPPTWRPIVEEMATANPDSNPDTPLRSEARIPIAHFAVSVDETMSAADLHARYVMLLKRACRATQTSPSSQSPSPSPFLASPSPPSINTADLDDIQITTTTAAGETSRQVCISYNLAMTRYVMAILPRRSEAGRIPGFSDDDDDEESTVAVNGTILAGTLMVKVEKQWDALRSRPDVLDDLLLQIGFPVSGSRVGSEGTFRPTMAMSTL